MGSTATEATGQPGGSGIAPGDGCGHRQQPTNQETATATPQRAEALGPQQHRFVLPTGRHDQGCVIEQAAQACGILEQAAAPQHQGTAVPQGGQHTAQAAALHRGHTVALLHRRLVKGGHQGGH